MNGASEITSERRRQIEVKGWTKQHDANHDTGELLQAAMAYVRAAVNCGNNHPNNNPPWCWPWTREEWKPAESAQRNLVKAGALIAAEIDRLSQCGASNLSTVASDTAPN